MLSEMGGRARLAARVLGFAGTEVKNQVLLRLASLLEESRPAVASANQIDIDNAVASGMSDALVDRMTLTDARLDGLSHDLRAIARLPDPIGERFDAVTLPNGMKLSRQRAPLGVLGVIFESRPSVIIDIAGLSIKTGNAVIMRGGKETKNSNLALVEIILKSLRENSLPAEAVQFIDDPDRNLVLDLLNLRDCVDVIIPRGGEGLMRFCRENSRIPVITGGVGICHIFVDQSADLEKSLPVIHNAKTQRPSVCNALDTLLVHKDVAAQLLPRVVELLGPAGVTFRAHASAMEYLKEVRDDIVRPAESEDFDTEWMSLVLGLKAVDGIDEAIEHANAHSLGHSDSILTEDASNAARWINEVDSAAVYVNASTRFTDGGQFGLGAEVAVSTQRIHARGPMGLRELTTYKWVGEGDYLSRA